MSMLGGEGPSKGRGFNQEAHGLWVTILIVHRIEDNIVSYIYYLLFRLFPPLCTALLDSSNLTLHFPTTYSVKIYPSVSPNTFY